MRPHLILSAVVILAALLASVADVRADQDEVGGKPYLGWSSWSIQSFHPSGGGDTPWRNWLTAEHVKAQSDAMHQALQKHGYIYINLDAGWNSGYDSHGLPLPDAQHFPEGISGIAAYVHNNGQKLGVYVNPGIEDELLKLNPVILGTSHHIQDIVLKPVRGATGWNTNAKIDFSRPGAQEYIDSIASEFAGWGVDFIKLDGVTPGSGHNDTSIDARADVIAWKRAIKDARRPMWLELSWALDHDYAAFWEAHANGRRITDDVESHGATFTDWRHVLNRFDAAARWSNDAGPGKGWNDLDSLDIGNGALDGLTDAERRTSMTLWAISCAPLYCGDDLTTLDPVGLALLTNDEVIAIDQAGRPATRMTAGEKQLWRIENTDGSQTVALFNLNDKTQATVTVLWSNLGIHGAADVRDVWTGADLGHISGSYSADLAPHASCLLTIIPQK